MFSADGAPVLAASYDETAKMWNSATGECLLTLAVREDVITSAVFSADGASVLTASDDSTAKIWSSATGECLLTRAGR